MLSSRRGLGPETARCSPCQAERSIEPSAADTRVAVTLRRTTGREPQQLRAADQRNGTTSAFRFDFGAAGAGAAAATAPAPADADAVSATSRPITRIAAVQATAAETRVVEAGGERFDLTVETGSSQVVEAGVYEGGRELWECAIDLVEWLAAHRRPSGTVLELGCGRGLPGLWCLKRGAQQVVFSDYDADVLERYTRVDAARVGGQCHFYGGDWRGLPAALRGDGFGTKFDLILSAETAYREDTTHSLVECIAKTLSVKGEAIVATKRYYFGCGGGVAALENEVGRVDRLCCEVVWSAEDGRSNVRDILRVFWKKGE